MDNKQKVVPTWQFPELLKQHEKDTDVKLASIDKKILTESTKLQRYVDAQATSYNMRLDKHLTEQQTTLHEMRRTHNALKDDYNSKIEHLHYLVTELGSECRTEIQKQTLNAEDATRKVSQTLSRIQLISGTDAKGNTVLMFTDASGNVTRTDIKQILEPDNITICNDKGILRTVLSPDQKSILVDDSSKFYVAGLLDDSGDVLTASTLKEYVRSQLSKLHEFENKITGISESVQKQLDRLDAVHGFATSYDFKTAKPSQKELTNFAIAHLHVTKDELPHNMRVKNLYDNRIWILNQCSQEGLTTFTWEDFGTDNVQIANNAGVVGTVAGSTERYRGFVDINGVVSINGLEETLSQILKSINTLQNEFVQFKSEVSAKLYK